MTCGKIRHVEFEVVQPRGCWNCGDLGSGGGSYTGPKLVELRWYETPVAAVLGGVTSFLLRLWNSKTRAPKKLEGSFP